MCAVCVSPVSESWPIFILCDAGVQRREGQLTETLRSHRIPFRVLETVRGASPVGGRARLHRRAWRAIRGDDLPGAIIIEDGARLSPDFVNFMSCGGYLHADLTQLCHGNGRVWRWGGCNAADGVRLRPLAASTGLASGYALSRRGAAHLLRAYRASADVAGHEETAAQALTADWPCDVSRMGALVSVPALVEAPQWLAEASPRPEPRRAVASGQWNDAVNARASAPVARHARTTGGLRALARETFSREMTQGI
ncbi:hypothetical protein PAF17_15100 [Paracoccus sp. Z330]|uniref:Uncharacterized protein n=1 Tax=Paracoccus onchidii TaxID=3017813 RepID=A0ABT4ZIJ6_9RHOB|nr:hypothetical protein [Paracoccus onchidii]MDB6178823.1 hypothetical protein [Paracoccus onchidii]